MPRATCLLDAKHVCEPDEIISIIFRCGAWNLITAVHTTKMQQNLTHSKLEHVLPAVTSAWSDTRQKCPTLCKWTLNWDSKCNAVRTLGNVVWTLYTSLPATCPTPLFHCLLLLWILNAGFTNTISSFKAWKVETCSTWGYTRCWLCTTYGLLNFTVWPTATSTKQKHMYLQMPRHWDTEQKWNPALEKSSSIQYNYKCEPYMYSL